jgi:hypothetical protein
MEILLMNISQVGKYFERIQVSMLEVNWARETSTEKFQDQGKL